MKKIFVVLTAILLSMCLTMPALAAGFTPSVESKPAPELVQMTDSNGNQKTAIIKDADGNEVAIPENVELVVTATSEKDKSPVSDVQEMLTRAEEQIKNAANLGELTPDLAAALEEAKANLQDQAVQSVTIEDLVVQDLFDVSFIKDGKTLEKLLQEGQSVTFAIQTNLTNDDLFFVLHNYSDTNWEVVKDIKLQDDGVLEITLTGGLSPIAIVVDGAANLETDPEGPNSPQTGDELPVAYLMCAAIFGVAAAFLFSKARKQHTA